VTATPALKNRSRRAMGSSPTPIRDIMRRKSGKNSGPVHTLLCS
jgi:hypothetical protein